MSHITIGQDPGNGTVCCRHRHHRSFKSALQKVAGNDMSDRIWPVAGSDKCDRTWAKHGVEIADGHVSPCFWKGDLRRVQRRLRANDLRLAYTSWMVV